MARRSTPSLADIESQIEALQKPAAELRAAEIDGVIERKRLAIAPYGLTADQLGFTSPGRVSKGRRVASTASRADAAPKKRLREVKPAGVVEFGDGDGKTWTGVGKRSGWFKDAIAAGKTPEELLLQS